MHYWEAIVLGLIQGLTEFLPVSSSGHLVLAQNLLGVNSAGVILEVALHLGTVLSVIIVYWRDVVGLFRGFFSLLSNPAGKRLSPELDGYRRFVLMLVIGSIPTAILGFGLQPVFDRLFDSQLAVGCFLIVTGAVLWLISRLRPGRRGLKQMRIKDALLVGLAQGLAIAPGLSRSGMTISSGLSRGLTRETATRFSFLLSLPAIGGAALLQLKDVLDQTAVLGDVRMLAVGFVSAVVAGILAIKLVVGLLKHGRLQYFAYYVWVVGLLAIWKAI